MFYSNFNYVLEHRANFSPNRIAFRYLKDGEFESDSITFAELNVKALQVAQMLLNIAKPGDRVLLMFPHGLEFIWTILGCFYAGIVAVPMHELNQNRRRDRLQNVVNDCNALFALTSGHMGENSDTKDWFTEKNLNLQFADIHWLIEKYGNHTPKDLPVIQRDTIALLQYTSGSTGNPKGVILTHRNLLHNQEILKNIFRSNKEPEGEFSMVSWLPFFHDMGLIAGLLHPIYMGGSCTLMSPISFLYRPWNWLRAITKYKATITGAPNFAFEYCVTKISENQMEGINLTNLKNAFCGSEPIRKQAIDKFIEKFSKFGFAPEAFIPAYGLAEATLGVAGIHTDVWKSLRLCKKALEKSQIVPILHGENKPYINFVSIGKIPANIELKIVNPTTCLEAKKCSIGEIWIKSDSNALGYWNNSIETENVFQAKICATNAGKFLRSGDLGFIYEDELYITGRCKDLIIIDGRNHFPQDIEYSISELNTQIVANGVAAFSVDGISTEQLIIVMELQPRSELLTEEFFELLFKKINQVVSIEHSLRVASIIIIPKGEMPRTTSGKVMRRRTKSLFENGKLVSLSKWNRSKIGDCHA